jgi:hypothetical protein
MALPPATTYEGEPTPSLSSDAASAAPVPLPTQLEALADRACTYVKVGELGQYPPCLLRGPEALRRIVPEAM